MLEKIKKLTWYNLVNNLKDILEGLWNKPAESVTWDSVEEKPTTFPPAIGTTATTAKAGNYQPTWAQVSGKPTTFEPIIGTTATTAKAGNYVPTWAEVSGKPSTFTPTIGTTASTAKAGNYAPTWAEVSAKPAIIASGATQAEARTAIGAGTGNSNLAIGTTASTAKAGNYTPSATEVVTALNAMTPEQIEEIQLLLGVTP